MKLTPSQAWYDRDHYETWYEGFLLVGYVVDRAGMSQTRFELIRRLTVKAGQPAEQIAEGTRGGGSGGPSWARGPPSPLNSVKILAINWPTNIKILSILLSRPILNLFI
jgi:hypothetical protein